MEGVKPLLPFAGPSECSSALCPAPQPRSLPLHLSPSPQQGFIAHCAAPIKLLPVPRARCAWLLESRRWQVLGTEDEAPTTKAGAAWWLGRRPWLLSEAHAPRGPLWAGLEWADQQSRGRGRHLGFRRPSAPRQATGWAAGGELGALPFPGLRRRDTCSSTEAPGRPRGPRGVGGGDGQPAPPVAWPAPPSSLGGRRPLGRPVHSLSGDGARGRGGRPGFQPTPSSETGSFTRFAPVTVCLLLPEAWGHERRREPPRTLARLAPQGGPGCAVPRASPCPGLPSIPLPLSDPASDLGPALPGS